DRIDTEMRRGETERWIVSGREMQHPFHVHATHFTVLRNGGRDVDFARTGLKDTVLVEGEAEILVRIDRTADASAAFMYHCHILEHEDAGMMAALVVA
ncbi:MAG: cupredoxin, partial [Alphaproteobacteria bacterium]